MLFVEPNNLVVSYVQVCDNPLITRVLGQILSKDNNFMPPSSLFLFDFCVILILPLLHCVLLPTHNSSIYFSIKSIVIVLSMYHGWQLFYREIEWTNNNLLDPMPHQVKYPK